MMVSDSGAAFGALHHSKFTILRTPNSLLMKGITSLISVLFLCPLLAFSSFNADSELNKIKASDVVGPIEIIDEATGIVETLNEGQIFPAEGTIVTGEEASVILYFSNGSLLVVGAETSLNINEFDQKPFDSAATYEGVNVVNQNVNQYFLGNEQNGIYNGYSWWPLLTGACEATSFSHFYNYEPHTFNNVVPKHGILSQLYFTQLQRSLVSFGTKYSGMKKNAGPPYYRAAKPWPPIDANNDYKRFKSLSPAL